MTYPSKNKSYMPMSCTDVLEPLPLFQTQLSIKSTLRKEQASSGRIDNRIRKKDFRRNEGKQDPAQRSTTRKDKRRVKQALVKTDGESTKEGSPLERPARIQKHADSNPNWTYLNFSNRASRTLTESDRERFGEFQLCR